MRLDEPNNEEMVTAYRESMESFVCAVLTEEEVTACVAVIQEFADFISPVPLADATKREQRLFRLEKGLADRKAGLRPYHLTRLAMIHFEAFLDDRTRKLRAERAGKRRGAA